MGEWSQSSSTAMQWRAALYDVGDAYFPGNSNENVLSWKKGTSEEKRVWVFERIYKVLVTPQGVMEKSMAWGNEEPWIRQAYSSLPPHPALSFGHKAEGYSIFIASETLLIMSGETSTCIYIGQNSLSSDWTGLENLKVFSQKLFKWHSQKHRFKHERLFWLPSPNSLHASGHGSASAPVPVSY